MCYVQFTEYFLNISSQETSHIITSTFRYSVYTNTVTVCQISVSKQKLIFIAAKYFIVTDRMSTVCIVGVFDVAVTTFACSVTVLVILITMSTFLCPAFITFIITSFLILILSFFTFIVLRTASICTNSTSLLSHKSLTNTMQCHEILLQIDVSAVYTITVKSWVNIPKYRNDVGYYKVPIMIHD